MQLQKQTAELATAASHLPGDLPPGVLEACTSWDVPAGRTLPASGAACDACYFLRSGMMELVRACPDGTTSLIDVLEPGQWVGTDDLLAPHGEGLIAETASACSLYVLRRSRMLQLMEASPAVRSWLMAAAGTRMQRMAQRMHAMATLDAVQRVRWTVALLMERFGRTEPAARVVPMRVSQTQLARISGTSRQKVNYVVAALKREKQLVLRAGRLVHPVG